MNLQVDRPRLLRASHLNTIRGTVMQYHYQTLSATILLILSACSVDPKLQMTKLAGADPNGADKFCLRAPVLQVATKVESEVDQTGNVIEKVQLIASVESVEHQDKFTFKPKDDFLQETTVNITPVTDTCMPAKLSVEVTDKLGERIQTIAAVAKTGIALAGVLSSASRPPNVVPSEDQIKKQFGRWAIDLRNEMKVGSREYIPKAGRTLTDTFADRLGHNWTYELVVGPTSSSAVALEPYAQQGDVVLNLAAAGDQGIIFYSSCREAILTLKYWGTQSPQPGNPIWQTSFTKKIAEPRWPETLSLPDKGTVVFNHCSASRTTESTVSRDFLDILKIAGEEAAAVAKASKEQNKTQ